MSGVGQVLGTTANALIEGWIIDPYVHGLLDDPYDVVCLSTHNGEGVQPGVMTHGVGMVIDGGRGPKMFLEPFPKGPYTFIHSFI